jgi:hypothetical protein
MYAKIIDMGNIDAAPKSKLHFPKSWITSRHFVTFEHSCRDFLSIIISTHLLFSV